MQVVYEEVLKILFAFRENLGLISISKIPLSMKGHFRYSRLSKNFHMDFSAVTWGPLEPCNLLEHQLPCSYVSANKSAC